MLRWCWKTVARVYPPRQSMCIHTATYKTHELNSLFLVIHIVPRTKCSIPWQELIAVSKLSGCCLVSCRNAKACSYAAIGERRSPLQRANVGFTVCRTIWTRLLVGKTHCWRCLIIIHRSIPLLCFIHFHFYCHYSFRSFEFSFTVPYCLCCIYSQLVPSFGFVS